MNQDTFQKVFTIGREGNQPFPITDKQKRVSRKHCSIKVEGERFSIKDLGSANGTSVRDDKTGEIKIVPIDEYMEISPFSLVCLGESSKEGCTFYPYTLVSPEDYRPIFDFLRDKEDSFDEETANLEKRISMQKKIVFALNFVVLLASFDCPKLGLTIDQETRMWMLRIVPLASTGFAAFYDASSKKKRIEEKRKNFHHCPNPSCYRMLRTDEIRMGICKCMKTKKKQ